jgi:hypothetical protein
LTLREKIFQIQKLARAVPKKGYNKSEDFKYVRAQEIISTGTRFMKEHNLYLIADVKSFTRTPNERGGGSVVDLIVSWELHNLDATEIDMIQVDVPGSGWDYGSKATAKALTDSRKSALVLLFNLKGGDDPEERSPRESGKASAAQVADDKLANAAAGRGLDADVPKLFYEIFPDSKTVELTGDKNLLKDPLLKKYKLMGKFIVKEGEWDALKLRIEESGVNLSNLRTQ